MFAFYIRILTKRFTERNLRFGKFNIYFIAFFQLAYYDVKMLVAHTVNQALAVGTVIDNLKSIVLTHHLGK